MLGVVVGTSAMLHMGVPGAPPRCSVQDLRCSSLLQHIALEECFFYNAKPSFPNSSLSTLRRSGGRG